MDRDDFSYLPPARKLTTDIDDELTLEIERAMGIEYDEDGLVVRRDHRGEIIKPRKYCDRDVRARKPKYSESYDDYWGGRSRGAYYDDWYGGEDYSSYTPHDVTKYDRSKGSYSSSWQGRFGGSWSSWGGSADTEDSRMREAMRLVCRAVVAVEPVFGGLAVKYGRESEPLRPPSEGAPLLALNPYIPARSPAHWKDQANDAIVGDGVAYCALHKTAGPRDGGHSALKRRFNMRELDAANMLISAVEVARSTDYALDRAPGYLPYIEARIDWYIDKGVPAAIANDLRKETPENASLVYAAAWKLLARGRGDDILQGASQPAIDTVEKLIDMMNSASSKPTLDKRADALGKWPITSGDDDYVEAVLFQLNGESMCLVGSAVAAMGLLFTCTDDGAPAMASANSNEAGPDSGDHRSDDETTARDAASWEAIEPWEMKSYIVQVDPPDNVARYLYQNYLRRCGTLIRGLKNRLQFRTTENTRDTCAHRSGSLDEGGLHKLTHGDDRIFSQVETHPVSNVLITLLIDQSGSMRAGANRAESACTRMQCANETAIVIAEALASIPGVSLAIYYHTGEPWSDNPPCEVRRVKRPDDPHSMAMVCATMNHESENYDGSAIKTVVRDLRSAGLDKYESRALFVISDGAPCDGYQGVSSACEYSRRNGIEAYGIGIDNAYSEDFGELMYGKGNFVVLQKSEDIPLALGSWITKICAR